MRCFSFMVGGLLLVLGTITASAKAESFEFYHEHVLGTSLKIVIEADSSATADKAEALALQEIDRLDAIFSTYNAKSEFSRWQANVGKAQAISPELYDVLKQSERWQQLSGGAFNPAAAAVAKVWANAEKLQRLPVQQDLAQAVEMLAQPQWKLGAKPQAMKLGEASLTLNAIAKGAIVDAASQAARRQDGVQGVLVCIGGDMTAWGQSVTPVAIADPHNDAENAAPIAKIYVENRSLATSGNYRRGYDIAGVHYSHILDPRSGQPVDHVHSATVLAPTAADADALATIFNVLSVSASQQLAASLSDVDYLLVTDNGQQVKSKSWDKLTLPRPTQFTAVEDEKKADEAKAADKAAGGLELVVNFELDRPEGGRYRRPYVAVWLEDEDEFPVRTALLWMQTKDPGPRWHRDLLRWYRQDGVRKLADGKALIGTISGATRGPGKYTAVFDGLDDNGKPLPAGKYTLFLEVAREHGTYQLIRQQVTLGDKPVAATDLKSNVEVKSASFEYRTPKAQAADKAAAQ